MTGGGTNEAELYNPISKISCILPQLPEIRSLHSQNGPLLCGGNMNTHLKPRRNCMLWNSGKVYLYHQRKIFKYILGNGTWIQSHTLPTVRHYHSSWTPASGTGTYLLGGGGGASEYTSDLVKPDGTVEKTFNLKHKTV